MELEDILEVDQFEFHILQTKKNKVQRRKIDIKMNFNSNFKMTEACVHIFLRATMNHLNAFSCIHTLNYSEGFKKDIDGERGPRYSVECTKDY